MISISEFLIESTQNIGGMIGRATSAAIPIPGASVVLSPVTAKVGETIGKILPKTKSTPDIIKDSVKIYAAAGDKNTSVSIKDQLEAKKKHIKKAKELGYNKIGQVAAAIDPSLISIVPKL